MRYTGHDEIAAMHGRGAERVKLQGHAQLCLTASDDQTPISVKLEDLSCSGAGVVAPLNLNQKTPVVLMLNSPDRLPHGVRGQVLSSSPIGNGQFRIGLEFDVAGGLTIERIRHAFFPDDAMSTQV